MDLKITKRKVAVSFMAAAIWYSYLFLTTYSKRCLCYDKSAKECIDYNYLHPLGFGCHCGCTSLTNVLLGYFIAIILPFAVGYIGFSVFEQIKKDKKKK
jgi:hypothetical protein